MIYQNVSWERLGMIATLTITQHHSLNTEGMTEMLHAVQEIEQERTIRALIVTGLGEEALLADVAGLVHLKPPEALDFSELGQRLCNTLEALPIPTIAAVDGLALGGGCEIVISCDLTYASSRSHFGQIEVGGGIIPGFGGTRRLARRVGTQRARELIFTGEIIDAARARELGLVLEVVAGEQLLDYCHGVAQKITAKAPLAVSQAKKMIVASADLPLAAANALERQAFARLFGTNDQKEGMTAFLEKRSPQFQGD